MTFVSWQGSRWEAVWERATPTDGDCEDAGEVEGCIDAERDWGTGLRVVELRVVYEPGIVSFAIKGNTIRE
jgi:hypothetical protein